MARTLMEISLKEDINYINSILENYFNQAGYENKFLNDEKVLLLKDGYGKLYFLFSYKTDSLRVETWLQTGKKEICADDSPYHSINKQHMAEKLQEIANLFPNTEVITINTEKVDRTGYTLLNFDIELNFKIHSILALAISVLCIFIPLNTFFLTLIFVLTIMLLIIKGIKGKLKILSILSIIIFIFELLIHLLYILGLF